MMSVVSGHDEEKRHNIFFQFLGNIFVRNSISRAEKLTHTNNEYSNFILSNHEDRKVIPKADKQRAFTLSFTQICLERR